MLPHTPFMVSIHCVRIFDKIIIIKCFTAQAYFSNTFFLLPLFPSTAVWFYDVKLANVFDKCYKCFTCNLLISHRNKWVINGRKKTARFGKAFGSSWKQKITSENNVKCNANIAQMLENAKNNFSLFSSTWNDMSDGLSHIRSSK